MAAAQNAMTQLSSVIPALSPYIGLDGMLTLRSCNKDLLEAADRDCCSLSVQGFGPRSLPQNIDSEEISQAFRRILGRRCCPKTLTISCGKPEHR
jgi:hypothetical protein